MVADWIDTFPDLAGLDAESRGQLRARAQHVTMPGGVTVFSPGGPCENYLLVLDGAVRVQMTGDTGREIVLYRVGTGEACIMTTACLLNADVYSAEGITEGAVEAVVIPAGLFNLLLGRSPVFRSFVFGAFGDRLSDLLLLMEEVAFKRVDVRLAKFLSERGGDGAPLSFTHQAIAAELGTAREVVSRQLKEFERRGWVSLKRGQVAVLEARALADLAGD